MPYILEIYLEDSWALIFESKFVRIITKKIATRIMDLNQYLDRMSIKTTIIRIHDVGKAYIRLLTSRASILRPGIKVPPPFWISDSLSETCIFALRTSLVFMDRARMKAKEEFVQPASWRPHKRGGYSTLFYYVKHSKIGAREVSWPHARN